MFTIIASVICICTVFLTIATSLANIRDYNKKDEFKIDKDTYDIAIKHLEKLIKFETIYKVNAEIGNTMSNSIGASIDMSNEQIESLNSSVKQRVLECLSPEMRDFFTNNFGTEWLLDYIRIYTLSMILGYSELSMTSLLYDQEK